jgi:hypothetical protein
MLARALVPAAVLTALVAAPAQAAQVSSTFTTVGESEFVVPTGVHRLDVTLTGARGGTHADWAPGGRGALVAGSLPVVPGARLYAVVGAAGTDSVTRYTNTVLPGGFNGGGPGITGGGGASDIRMLPVREPGSLWTRVAVAGGGGGAAWDGLNRGGGGGGDAGAAGVDASGGHAGGRPGTLTAGGLGGVARDFRATDGTPGALGQGGAGGGPIGAGGGGGGLYGGGGGAGMAFCTRCDENGGGGGGSSLVPAGGTVGLAAAGAAPQVTISYERAEAGLNATRLEFPSTQPGAISPSRRLELRNTATSTDLIVSGLSLGSGDFVLGASTCFGALAPGAACSIDVRFAPTAAGPRRSALRIESNADPLTVALSGDGAAAPPTVAPGGDGAGAPPAAAPAPAVATVPPRAATGRVTCVSERCRVTFAGTAPKLTARTRVRATLTRSGRVYATADRVARRGMLRLVLRARRAVKPGAAYTLTLWIGRTRTTQAVVAQRRGF